MPTDIASAYRAEREAAKAAGRAGDHDAAWHHLERAHILAQPWAAAHVGSHLAMLALAIRTRDPAEASGQLVRAALAGPASLAGRAPTGNTGRARMPLNAIAPMPDDLDALLAAHRAP